MKLSQSEKLIKVIDKQIRDRTMLLDVSTDKEAAYFKGCLDMLTYIRQLIIAITEEPEAVNHPEHYGGERNPYEAIKVIEAWGLDFHLGNVVKYVSRAGKKGAAKQDLEKAKWYLERAIHNLK